MTDAFLLDAWAEVMCHECHRWVKMDSLIAELENHWLLFLCPFCHVVVIRNEGM
jgi:hypothetical protein